jgi:hypothetical protein
MHRNWSASPIAWARRSFNVRSAPPRGPGQAQDQGRKAPPQIDADQRRLLGALAREGCPLCHESADHDRGYFFWFFNENYYHAFAIDKLTRSLGFCRAHGELLARMMAGRSQLRYVHEMLVRSVRTTLAERAHDRPRGDFQGPVLRASGRCPACESRLTGEERNGFWLHKILEHPEIGDRYGRPGMLCFPHLQLVAPHLSDTNLLRVLRAHQASMIDTLRVLAAAGDDAVRHETPSRTLSAALALCVGHEANREAYPSVREHRSAVMRDPVREFLDSLQSDACPTCLEIRRAWLEWIAWLDAGGSHGDRIADLLPTCPDHTWAAVRQGGDSLAVAVTRHALDAALGGIGAAIPRPPAPPRRLWERLDEALWGPRRRIEGTRVVIARGLRCPVCERLAIAEARSTSLLFAVLEDRRHRAAFASGYGLCLKHFARMLAQAPASEARTVLVDVECARLATLYWELVEAGRKAAWQFRPEAKGTEETAWERALLRFSGSLLRAG